MGLKVKSEFFYEDNGIVDSTNLGWIQTTFNTLTETFYRVGLRENFKKTMEMVYHT